MAHNTPLLNGRVPAERVDGDVPDISMYIQFSWYQWVHFMDHNRETKLGGWLGPAIGIGNCHWILPIFCRPIASSTVFLIGDEIERAQHTIQAKQQFDEQVLDKLFPLSFMSGVRLGTRLSVQSGLDSLRLQGAFLQAWVFVFHIHSWGLPWQGCLQYFLYIYMPSYALP